MALTVACLTNPAAKRYARIAEAMFQGIQRCGDKPVLCELHAQVNADAAVMYGWKLSAHLRRYPQYVYADLGYWQRETYYRMTANGWSPESYVRAGLPTDRIASFGVTVKPWRDGQEVIVVGATRKSAIQHGYPYMQWERNACAQLQSMGYKVVYRPKPNDKEKRPISGVGYDQRPISEALASAKAIVTHHSNVAVEALAAGVPVHCVTGAAAAFSVPLDRLGDRLDGREQFLADVAYLQWSLDEMRSGAYWAHIKDRGVIRC